MTTIPTITRTASLKSQSNVDLLNFVNQRGEASFHALCANFGPSEPASRSARQQFIGKLSYLVRTQQLCKRGHGLTAHYWLGALACQPQPQPAPPQPKRCVLPPADSLLPQHISPWQIPITATPPAYDAMHAPAYLPPAMTAMRPGALDYRAIASHGHRC
jgi:hypothetical protein